MFAWYGLCLLHGMVYACCMVWSMPAAWYGLCLLHGMHAFVLDEAATGRPLDEAPTCSRQKSNPRV